MKFHLIANEYIQSGTGRVPNRFEHEFESVSLDDTLQHIEQFLRGCGFILYNLDYDTELLDPRRRNEHEV